MSEQKPDTHDPKERMRASEERLHLAETASGVGTFELDLISDEWHWTPQIAVLFGLDGREPGSSFASWHSVVFFDDLPKLRAAIEAAKTTGAFHVEFRVRRPDGGVRWLAGHGQIAPDEAQPARCLRGAYFDITERKVLEARLLALNEILETRIAEVREDSRLLEVLNRTGIAVAGELDLERLVQTVTDAGVELTGAQFGAFFYNVPGEDGESYTLYTLSGASREDFAKFPMPRNTKIFEPTFRGHGPVRSPDILADPRYGQNPPYHGMPEGHLPVRSYLAVPVSSRAGGVLGGLFFGHPDPSVFTERAERIVTGLAAHAAVAIDNARLYQASQREVTARQQVEQQLQSLIETLEERASERAGELFASNTMLADTERRFRLLVEGVTDYAIYMLDATGMIVNWNKGAERIKGYSRNEILGQHFSRFYTEQDRKDGVPQRALLTAAETGKYEAEGWRIRKDGTTFWAGVVINAVRDPSGELLGYAKITRDLTERRGAEDRFRQAQKMEGIGQITGGVAHDFNNLLTIILGNLGTLQRRLNAPNPDLATMARLTDFAMRGAQRAAALTQRLLAFSRQQPLDPKPLDANRLVTTMSDLLRRTIGEHIAIETILAGGLWLVHTDSTELEIAILNLAVNSRDAMPKGGKLTIETANTHLDESYAASEVEVVPGQYVLVAVSDTGTGMSRETVTKAFEPFFTTKEVGQGTGLGLSQVYGFVKQSGGHVRIYSELGRGTTVKIYLPRLHADVPTADFEPQDIVPRGHESEAILVVEDEDDVRVHSTSALRELGYTVLEATDAKTALAMLQKNPHIVVMFTDVGLPGGMNGRQLAEAAQRIRKNLKILYTTGYARNAIVHDGRLDVGVQLVTKPFTFEVLAAKLRKVLDSRTTSNRVLLVEDEVLLQIFVIENLEEMGFEVEAANTANEALNRLRLLPDTFCAAIVDIGLPDKRGDVLVAEIRALLPSMPIVIASGHTLTALQKRFGNDERIAFVIKPYSSEELRSALQSVGATGEIRAE